MLYCYVSMKLLHHLLRTGAGLHVRGAVRRNCGPGGRSDVHGLGRAAHLRACGRRGMDGYVSIFTYSFQRQCSCLACRQHALEGDVSIVTCSFRTPCLCQARYFTGATPPQLCWGARL